MSSGHASLLLNVFVCQFMYSFYSIVAPRIILPNSVYTLTTIAADWPQFMTFNKKHAKASKINEALKDHTLTCEIPAKAPNNQYGFHIPYLVISHASHRMSSFR